MRKAITFDKAKLASFKCAIEAALMRKEEVFVFEGEQFLVDYAQYLVEYLESKL